MSVLSRARSSWAEALSHVTMWPGPQGDDFDTGGQPTCLDGAGRVLNTGARRDGL